MPLLSALQARKLMKQHECKAFLNNVSEITEAETVVDPKIGMNGEHDFRERRERSHLHLSSHTGLMKMMSHHSE